MVKHKIVFSLIFIFSFIMCIFVLHKMELGLNNTPTINLVGGGLVKVNGITYTMNDEEDKHLPCTTLIKKIVLVKKIFGGIGTVRFNCLDNASALDLKNIYNFFVLDNCICGPVVEFVQFDNMFILIDSSPGQGKSMRSVEFGDYIPFFMNNDGLFYLEKKNCIKKFEPCLLKPDFFKNKFVEIDCLSNVNCKKIISFLHSMESFGVNDVNIVVVDELFTLKDFESIHSNFKNNFEIDSQELIMY